MIIKGSPVVGAHAESLGRLFAQASNSQPTTNIIPPPVASYSMARLALACCLGLVAAENSMASLRGCQAEEGAPCRPKPWMFWIRASSCCGNMDCRSDSAFGSVCVRPQKQCVPQQGTCGGPGQQTQQCCGNAECQQLLGGSEMKCVERQSCVAQHGTCGGPGQLTQQCCGNAECRQLLGGSEMKCVEQPSCVAEQGTCGGPGQQTQQCCGNAECRKLLGGSEMKCVERQSFEQQSCVAEVPAIAGRQRDEVR
ncbi:unnamed protein product [Effrenium voratum]|nr:unnamed protein product [Effrenium voratum]